MYQQVYILMQQRDPTDYTNQPNTTSRMPQSLDTADFRVQPIAEPISFLSVRPPR